MSSTVKERLIKEIDDLPLELQEKIFKLVHFMKEEILLSQRAKSKDVNALSGVDRISIETGISDLSYQHDHYLYGIPKK